MPPLEQFATTTAAVCAAIVGIAAAAAVVIRLGRWAYAETERRHRLDSIVDMGPSLEKVVHELSPNSGESMFDRVTTMATITLPDLLDRFVPVEAYVHELKARDRRRLREIEEPRVE